MSNTKEDPANLALRSKPQPVTRLNRRTLMIATCVIGGSILSASLWSLQRKPTNTAEVSTSESKPASSVAKAEGLAVLPKDYASIPPVKNIPQLGSPLGELGTPVLKREQAAGLYSPPMHDAFMPNAEEDEQRANRLRRAQEAEAAQKATVFFQLSRHAAAQSSQPPMSNAESAFDKAMKMIPAALSANGLNASAASTQTDQGTAQNLQGAKQSFLKQSADSSIYGSGSLQTPMSPYQLMAGTVIAAALITGINSDLPGQIMASVTENIYDTVTGDYLLVPQGSRLLGQYDSQVAYGQKRVLLVWTRLLLPDGASILLDRLPGMDERGQSGLQDQINWHWARVFEGAALSTLIGVTAELAAPQRNNSNTVVVAGQQSLQSTVTEVGQQLTRKNLNVQPTITVRPGFPVRVIVNKDLILRPFQLNSATALSRVP